MSAGGEEAQVPIQCRGPLQNHLRPRRTITAGGEGWAGRWEWSRGSSPAKEDSGGAKMGDLTSNCPT